MDNAYRTLVINAAGGNATAIGIVSSDMGREWYKKEGSRLIADMESFDVEQAGFLVMDRAHFEMSGSEFCGNAARAAAMLFSMLNENTENFTFTMSGYNGPVEANIAWTQDRHADVTVIFESLKVTAESVTVLDNVAAKVVDLGGIVHVMIEDEFPKDYETQHRVITKELEFSDRGAVGVNWFTRSDEGVSLHPVVWVRDIDSFFYETACGSGSIAAAAVTGAEDITQPSGQSIQVHQEGDSITLHSPMEITHDTA